MYKSKDVILPKEVGINEDSISEYLSLNFNGHYNSDKNGRIIMNTKGKGLYCEFRSIVSIKKIFDEGKWDDSDIKGIKVKFIYHI